MSEIQSHQCLKSLNKSCNAVLLSSKLFYIFTFYKLTKTGKKKYSWRNKQTSSYIVGWVKCLICRSKLNLQHSGECKICANKALSLLLSCGGFLCKNNFLLFKTWQLIVFYFMICNQFMFSKRMHFLVMEYFSFFRTVVMLCLSGWRLQLGGDTD